MTQTKETTRWFLALALFAPLALFGCDDGDSTTAPDGGTDGGADGGGDVEMTTLSGIAAESVLGVDTPIAGMNILVDLGTSFLTATTGADGMFELQVPKGQPITVTGYAAGRTAVTFAGIVADEEEMPLDFWSTYVDYADYEIEAMTVSGTIAGAPVGSLVAFYGNDQFGAARFSVENEEPVAFSFETTLYGETETIDFTATAFDATTGEVLDSVIVSAPRGDETPLEVVMPGVAPTVLTVTANAPSLNGVPLESIDATYGYISAGTLIGDFYNDYVGGIAFTGFAQDPAITDGVFTATVSYVPMPDRQNVLRILLNSDFSDPASNFAIANIDLEPGATTASVELLDSPKIVSGDVFEPGATISWEPVEGAEDYKFAVIENNVAVWWIMTRNTSVTFPRFPEGFDTSAIATGGGWMVRANTGAFWKFEPGQWVGHVYEWSAGLTTGGVVSF